MRHGGLSLVVLPGFTLGGGGPAHACGIQLSQKPTIFFSDANISAGLAE